MLDIYKLNPKNFSLQWLYEQVLNYYAKNGDYPHCINLNKEQMYDLYAYTERKDYFILGQLMFCGIPVKFCTEEKKENDGR